MNPENFARVLELFAEARECPPGEQAAFLAQACPDDEAVRQEVVSLLRAHGAEPDFLAAPVFQDGLALLNATATGGELQPGAELGDCRILSLLGEGGMGEVYLAQDNKLERRVAVKLLKRRLDDGSLARRFRHERRVLAALTHPNIARLYGGGTTPEGRSYLVMEYVDGERLDRFCERRGLGVAERLTLFRKVCAAVAYAHQNLVVHRDLKPANIRVTPEGEPKLLDFGIAKLLDPESGTAGQVDPTVTMDAAMTPEYASPEQIKGEPITTASDVYSLGVVLYELLCGQRPYASLKSRRPDELVRAICEQEPPRPSTVASRTAATTATATVVAGASPVLREPARKLRRQLEGDLDNIVAKALRKEPGRRYPSVLALSEDLRRHCEGLPVSARKDTLGYRAGKFVRRNKVGVAAAALVVLALLGGLAATTWQARVAKQERDRARQAQARADTALTQSELARKQAERLNGFLQTLLGSANPEKGQGRDLKVIQVLDQASGQLDEELAGQPALLAQAHQTIGQAYSGLKGIEPALRHLRTALALNRQVYGEANIVTARSKAALGEAILYLQRNYAEAEPLLREALAAEKRQPPADRSSLMAILLALDRILSVTDRYDEAGIVTRDLLATAREVSGENSELYAQGLNAVGMLYVNKGNNAAAEVPLRQAVDIYRRVSPNNPLLATGLADAAYNLLLQGKTDEPEGILRDALDLHRRLVGEDSNPYHFDMALLGFMHYERGDYVAAEREMRYAVDYLIPRYPRDDEDMVGGRVVLGLSLIRLSRPAEGEPYLREAFDIAQANHFTGPLTSLSAARSALAQCLLAQKCYAEAEPLLLSEYADVQIRLGAPKALTTHTAGLLRDLYTAWNKPAEASRYQAGAKLPSKP